VWRVLSTTTRSIVTWRKEKTEARAKSKQIQKKLRDSHATYMLRKNKHTKASPLDCLIIGSTRMCGSGMRSFSKWSTHKIFGPNHFLIFFFRLPLRIILHQNDREKCGVYQGCQMSLPKQCWQIQQTFEKIFIDLNLGDSS